MIKAIIVMAMLALSTSALAIEPRTGGSGGGMDPTPYGQILFDQVQKGFSGAASTYGLRIVDRGKLANSWVNLSGNVYTTTAEIRWNRGHNDQMQFIWAHELCHVYLGHLYQPVFTNARSRAIEKQADLCAKKVMKKLGLNECAGGDYWLRAIKAGQTYAGGDGTTHPPIRQRYEYLRCK